MTHQYTQLHQYLLSAIDDIRLRLGDANIGHFELTITASGRTLGSESPRIEYCVGIRYSSDSAKSYMLGPAIDEHLRRHGWSEQNDIDKSITYQPS